MKANIYVNWNTKEILSECEMYEKIAFWIEEYMEGEAFNDFLNDNYSAVEIFDMTDEEKEEVEKEARATFAEELDNFVNKNWSKFTISLN